MTPCYICGSPIEELQLDYRDMKTRPCFTCEEIINEILYEEEDEEEIWW